MPIAKKGRITQPRRVLAGTAKSEPARTSSARKVVEKAIPEKPFSKRDRSLAKILDAAVHLFASKGYWNSTLEEVAAQAGFTKGAVYYHFKSKEQLLLKVLEIIETRSIDATIEGVKRRGGSPSQQLESFVKYHTQWAAAYPEDLAVMILMSVEVLRANTKIKSQMFGVYRKIGDFLEAIIDAGKRAGEFTTRQSTQDIVLYLQAVSDGNMLLWHRSGNDPSIGRKLTQITLSGFAHAMQS